MMRKHILSLTIALFSVALLSAQNFYVNEDFNAGALPTGWTNTAVSGTQTWSFGVDGSTADAGNNNLDGSSMVFFDDDALGGGSVDNTVALLTPVFNNAGAAQTSLSFDYNFRQFNAPADRFYVEVFDGTTWVSVFSVSTDNCGRWTAPACLGNYPSQNIDISAYANANCQVRFTYHDGNDWCWYVGLDNVVISSPFPNDIGVSKLFDPTSGCGLTSTQAIQVQIKNYGTLPASNFNITLDVDNGTQTLNELVTATIPAGDSLIYNFTGTVNMQTVAFYDINAYTNLTGDGNNVNDSLIIIVENEPSFIPTFTDNFEGINRWKVEGQNPSWEIGAPNNTFINASTSGTNAYVTNLDGNYNSLEESYLISPCFDFSTAIGDPIITFNLIYNTEAPYDSLTFESTIDDGLTWQKVQASANPTNWFNVGQHWEGVSAGWIPVENILTGLAGQSSVKLRFKFKSDGSVNREGVGIDDFTIRYPQPIDISLNAILYPSTTNAPICGLGNENIIVELENKGANTINSVQMNYRINNGAVVTETFSATILPNTVTTYSFTSKYNFTTFPSSSIEVWANVTGDGFSPNDSIVNRTITNSPANATNMPFNETFSGLGWGLGNGGPNGNSLFAAGWSRNPNTSGFGIYTWHVWNSATAAANTGPNFGRGGTGNFVHIASATGTGGSTAILESPCINLGSVNGAIMEYWTHGFGQNVPNLIVEVYDGSGWNVEDIVTTYSQTNSASPWEKQTVNLNNYAGRRIKLRFKTTKLAPFGAGDLSIDDVEIFEPIPADGKVLRVVSPVSGCTPSGDITIEVENFGSAPLTNIPVAFSIDGGLTIRDTVPGTLAPGARALFTFPITGNFTQKAKTYSLLVKTEVVGDSNLFNDQLIVDITNTTKDVSFEEDFSGFTDGSCDNNTNANIADVLGDGWEEVSTGSYQWHVHDVTFCGGGTGSAGTGPSTDHTSGGGKFLFTEASGGSSTAQIISPCIDFKGRSGAAIKFWYHMFGANIDSLILDVFANGQWNNRVGFIRGQVQTSEAAPWEEAIFKFNQFAGQDLRFRFRATQPAGFTGDLAIDDISFFAPYGKDARMLAVTGPEAGCNISDESFVSVRFDNFGTEQINPGNLTLFLQVDNNPPISEVIPFAVPAEDTVDYTFTTPVDLSIKGKTYYIKTWTSLNGEEDVENDTLSNQKIINQTKDTEYFENFERFRDSKCDQMIGQVLENGWVASDDDSFSWHVQSSQCGKGSATTPTASTGPDGDRTTGSGIFMYTEADGRGVANFQSPCIDLTNNVNPRLSFWYHRYGSNMTSMAVYVDTNGVENLVATLTGQSQTSASDIWKQFTVNLDNYVGHLVSVHFRAVKTSAGLQRSDMALDDVFFYEAIAKDAGVTEVIQPNGDACSLPSSATVQVKIENFGLSDILSGELTVQYNINDGPVTSETILQTIPSGSNLIYTFTTPIDLSQPGRKKIVAKTVLANDLLVANDAAFKKVTNRSPGIPRYFMDFEDLVQSTNPNSYTPDDLRNFVRTPANGGPGVYMWHVVTGTAPYVDGQPPMPPGPPTGPSGDHTFATNTANGKGTYMLVETDLKQLLAPIPPTIPNAVLRLPCGPIDLAQSANGSVLFSFWYHMFGPETGELALNVRQESTGMNFTAVGGSIVGEQQFDDTDRWLQKQISLDRFIDSGLITLSLIAINPNDGSYPGQGRGGDIAIDDIEILDRQQNDASMYSLTDPESDCALGISEPFEVRVQNVGTDDILKLNLGYQIIFTPLGGSPTALPVVKDSAVGITIIPLAFYDFSFQNIDLSAPGEYKIKVWTEYAGDSNAFNDTIIESIFNTTRGFPGCDDFSDLLFDDKAKNFKDGILRNSWEGNTTPNYTFKASIEGNADAPELTGHTGGLNDIFLLAFDGDGMPGQQAQISSACFDLNNTPAANLEFWYVMPAASGVLFVEARRVGGAWQPIDTIFNDPKVTWTKRRVVLADFVGDFVEFRFTGINTGGGYYAIDDVCVVRPRPQQIAFQEYLDPLPGNCFYSSDQKVSIRLRNIGIDNIASFRLVLAVDKGIISNPRGNYFRDTITINPGAAPPFFEPGDRLTVTLDSLGWGINMLEKTDYYFHVWILLDGDDDLEDNERLDFKVNHPGARTLPYIVTFETQPDRLNGLTLRNGMYTWIVNVGADPLFPGVTGPGLDHTKGPVDTTGFYLVSQAAAGEVGDEITATSQCIDLSTANKPEMKYWYHMFGFEMGNLYLEVDDDDGWVKVDSLVGEEPRQASNARTPWLSRIIDLDRYKGKFIKFRFTSQRGGTYSHMGIDDISVYDAVAKDIGIVGLEDPTADSTYCYSENNPFAVNIINNGSDSLDLEIDTLTLNVIIRKDNQGDGIFMVIDTLTQVVVTNQWLDANGNAYPIPRDSIATVAFDSTFDMSDTGSFYQFVVVSDLDGDFIVDNDEYRTIIKSQRKTGQIVSIFPNDSLCVDSALRVSVRNNFGALQWEELNILFENDPLAWRIGGSNPVDRRDYFPRLDTIHILRARICPELLFTEGVDETTDAVRIEIFAPWRPAGTAGGRCVADSLTDPDLFKVQVPGPNPPISDVRYYNGKSKSSDILATTNLAPDFTYVPADRPFDVTTSVYARSIVHIPNVANVGVNGLYCISDSAAKITRVISTPIPSRFPMKDTIVLCDSLAANQLADTVGLILDAGAIPGRKAKEYIWSRKVGAGPVEVLPIKTQTLAVEVLMLELDQQYTYFVETISDSTCNNKDTVVIDVQKNCTVGIENYELRKEFEIFPNPVSDVLTVRHESVDNFNGNIRLLGLEGQLIQLYENVSFGKLNKQIDMSSLAKGVYFIKLETDKGTVVQKVIKN